MSSSADTETLATINAAIVQALAQRDNDALSTLAEQQHIAVAAIFAAANESAMSADVATLLRSTAQLNDHVYQQITLQKQSIAHEQFDLKRRAHALQHYSDTGQL